MATKVAPAPEGIGFRPDQVRAGVRSARWGASGIDVIDLYQLHWPDATGVPVEDTWGAMAELQDAGKVRFIGVSNFDQALIERCEAIRHVDSLQQEFSMLALDDRDLIRWCGEQGTGVRHVRAARVRPADRHDLAASRRVSATDWRRADDDGPFSDEKLDHDLADRRRPAPDRRAAGHHHGAARAGVERGPAGRHVGDRRQPRTRITPATTPPPATSSWMTRRWPRSKGLLTG